ncbi:MAG: BRCT domain-containing protein [Candidatus Paceibacterota bacterium]|jgi:hypothetical protein
MTSNPKALKEARSYIAPALRYCLFDCSDSMYESEKIEARFEAVTDDKVSIGDFIAEHLFDDYIKVLKTLLVEYGNGDTIETFSCGVCEPPVPLEVVKKRLKAAKSVRKHSVTIYGASDDLVEINGDINEELSSIDQPTYLLFNDGSQVKVEYGADGVWCVNLVEGGKGSIERTRGYIGEESNVSPTDHPGTDISSYSDYAILTWDQPLKLIKHGHRKLSAPSPKQANALSRAERVIEYLESKGGFDHWWDDIDLDIKNEIVEGLARLLGGRSIEGKTFVITGTLSAPRKEIVERIEEAGGIVSSSISSKTDYLVVGEDAGSKVEKAQKLGIKMLSESELEEML